MKFPVFCIGTSAGGVDALHVLLESLPKDFKNPIVITQHVAADTSIDLKLVFGRFCHGAIFEASDKMDIQESCVYFAPPGYHLLIESDLTLSISQDEPVHFARPSIDVLFESASVALGDRCCGILLTGANQDGAVGLMEIKRAGGVTVVESPKTASHSAMPQAALDLFQPDYISDLKSIAQTMISISKGGLYDESQNLDRR